MKVVGIIVFVVLAIFVTWLVIDTIRYTIKKVQEKKARKNNKVVDTQKVDETHE